MDFDTFRAKLEVRLNVDYTEEQVDLYRDFTVPTIAFADPGTGKTHAAVAGLLTAELFHGIPAGNIYAMSFTREATVELRNRHEYACKKLGIGSLVNFKTLDSLCMEVIREHPEELSLPGWEVDSIQVTNSMSIEEASEFILDSAAENNIRIDPNAVKNVIFAIRSLNAALIFDKDHVESKAVFIKTKLSYEEFQILRRSMYDANKYLKKVRVDDIALYTLEILSKNKEISEKLKKRHKVMLVDEFQDMSLIKLELLSKMTDNLVVIGDMKQQIYSFNGACAEIVERYSDYYPNHREVYLTQSFRCSNQIADFSRELILPNEMGGESFKGVGDSSKVVIDNSFDLNGLCERIKEDFSLNGNKFEKDIMFLYRNNFSAVPIAEALFKHKIPMRIGKHMAAHSLPVIKDLCALAELAKNPMAARNLDVLNKCIPELRKFVHKPSNSPIFEAMVRNGMSLFEVNYQFVDRRITEMLYPALLSAKKAIEENQKTSVVFNSLFPFYRTIVLTYTEKYLELPSKYYLTLVEGIVKAKTYSQFVKDELEKEEYNNHWQNQRIGIRCLTFHSSKGTESDIVHIIDADEGIVPNEKKLEQAVESGASIDAARELRNERSLVFVASTRAKSELCIHYRDKLSPLFQRDSGRELDYEYKMHRHNYQDSVKFSDRKSVV